MRLWEDTLSLRRDWHAVDPYDGFHGQRTMCGRDLEGDRPHHHDDMMSVTCPDCRAALAAVLLMSETIPD